MFLVVQNAIIICEEGFPKGCLELDVQNCTMGNSVRVATFSIVLFVGMCVSDVALVAGSGPDVLDDAPIWNLTMAQCSLFRNETVLRPRFILWPEAIKSVPFRYCCEYQAGDPASLTPASFDLTGYRYGPDGATLMPALYFDQGLIDARYKWYWHHWVFWKLSTTRYSAPLYCDTTDLFRLYYHRFWTKVIIRALTTAAALIAVLIVCGIGVPVWRDERVRWEELFSDIFHVLLLALVGSCLMEGIDHSTVREWRAQLMFDGGVVYSYLTLFSMLSAVFRHAIRRRTTKCSLDWRWQKVFAQFATLFVVGAYLCLVEDVTGRRLDGVALFVLGTVVGASIWSAGVEMYVILLVFQSKRIIEATLGSSSETP